MIAGQSSAFVVFYFLRYDHSRRQNLLMSNKFSPSAKKEHESSEEHAGG
jgi:hypothetical protein